MRYARLAISKIKMFVEVMQEWFTVREASLWASEYLNKTITPSNISYLIQYARISKREENGNGIISKHDLKQYYNKQYQLKESEWKKKLGGDLNWLLSFSKYKESETTKHVHRLHSYKGKFIPQLVEYFLDQHIDDFKLESFFSKGDIVLDPFCGSGTTLVQANELNLHAIGVDISEFNSFMSNIKVGEYDLHGLKQEVNIISDKLRKFQAEKNNISFENRLSEELKIFNQKYFPSPSFKYKVRKKEIDEKNYGKEKSNFFLGNYNRLVYEYKIKLNQTENSSFLDKWFLAIIREELDFILKQIKLIKNVQCQNILSLILSRTARSCRATTHADLATLKYPMLNTYYCKKHGKICKPIFSISGWWNRYTQDTLKRLYQFSQVRTNTNQICLAGDARKLDINEALMRNHAEFGKLVYEDEIAGIFTSPPYVGLIDYHEQHAYSYELFDFERKDKLEIGALCKGQSIEARQNYVKGILDVFINMKRYLKPNYNIFIVANDRYNLYPQIAELANLTIVQQYRRPVLNRTEKDRSVYSETIFHMKEK